MMMNWVRHQSNSNARQTSKPPMSYSRGMVLFMVAKARVGGGCCVLLPGENIREVTGSNLVLIILMVVSANVFEGGDCRPA